MIPGRGRFAFHIPPESVFTSLRNPYSQFPGTLIHMPRNTHLNNCRYVLHDRDAKFCAEFRETLAAGDVQCLPLPPRSPNLNAFAERWVRSVKEECWSNLILFGEGSLRRALTQFQEHYHSERNHQGKGNVLLFPRADELLKSSGSSIECRERLGGLLKYYQRRAA